MNIRLHTLVTVHVRTLFGAAVMKGSTYELTSRMDPCLDGGGPSFSSRFILPHTMKMRMAVPTSKIKNNNMAITIPAIAPPPKPAADGKGEREIM